MRTRGSVVGGVTACLLLAGALAGCGTEREASADPQGVERLPVGPTEWDAGEPAWLFDGTLHVGDTSVDLGGGVDRFVLGTTGVYWMDTQVLMFTSAEGETQEVGDLGSSEIAVSGDHTVVAVTDQVNGPTDEYGTHVLQVSAYDTRTGELLYRTPDEEPDDGADLADLYEETTPLLQGVSDEQVFFDGETIDLADGSGTPMTQDAEGMDLYAGYAGTLFTDGFHVGLSGQGRTREPVAESGFAIGRLSPDRTTVFDVSRWPTPAVAYDATTGERREIGSPWRHFTLVGWSDDDTFFGVAEDIGPEDLPDVLVASQVVSCETSTLECTPVSDVVVNDDGPERVSVLVEGGEGW